MSDQPATSEGVAQLLAAMMSGRHPGFVSVKTSFPELDGTFTTVEVSVPADADDEEIARRITLAQQVQGAIRGTFFWGGPDINPANMIVPFGRDKGRTLRDLAENDPDSLEWLAYKATGVSPAFKIAAQWVLERGVAGDGTPIGKPAGGGSASYHGPL